MRFSIVGPIYPYRGGIAHYTYFLDQALQKAGHAVQVVSFKRQYPGWLYPGASDKDPSQAGLRSEAEFVLDPFAPWTWLKAAKTISAWEPHLVAIQWWTTFWAVPNAILCRNLKQQGLSTIYIIHNVLPHEERAIDKRLARLALSKGSAHLAQTYRQKERLLALLPQARVEVCSFPSYARFTDEEPTQAQARKTLELPGEGTVLLFFGIVRPYKGLDVMLEALERLQKDAVFPHLVIAGEFWEDLNAIQERIDALGLTGQVHIYNRYIPNEEVGLFFAAADVLVAPYVGGTQSAVIGLGFGFGIPMIASEKAAEGIDPVQRNAVQITPTGDASALAEAVRAFMARPKTPRAPVQAEESGWERLVDVLQGLASA